MLKLFSAANVQIIKMKTFSLWCLIFLPGVMVGYAILSFPLSLGLVSFMGFCALFSGVIYFSFL